MFRRRNSEAGVKNTDNVGEYPATVRLNEPNGNIEPSTVGNAEHDSVY
jgi:hypothetical protein